jgi:malate dehydrogenase (oxaloacetate-decarboxylating)
VSEISTDIQPTAAHSLTIRTETSNRPGTLGRVTTAIGEAGGDIGALDIESVGGGKVVRLLTVDARDETHAEQIVKALNGLEGVRVLEVSDRTFRAHQGGKIEVHGRLPVQTRDDLSMVYTPGVGRVCMAIHREPGRQWELTVKGRMVAVVTDGSAVLGLGDIGPAAAQPVMEGKCMLFKKFAGIDAFPICLSTKDPDAIVETVQRIAPVFGGINLEDIAAPKCFVVEDRLRQTLDIPVFHDDQHGTAVVVLAALENSLKLVGKSIDSLKVVINGPGAAGVAIAGILGQAGVPRIIMCDRLGAIYRGRTEQMNPIKELLANETNQELEEGRVGEILRGADVFIGVSGPGTIRPDDVRAMARDPIVFALANPIPEIRPELLVGIARVIATGRSDYANQINNSLAFPGLFRGALEVEAKAINEPMKLAAANAIAALVTDDELNEEYVIPSMFDPRVADAVAAATREAACSTGVARKELPISAG